MEILKLMMILYSGKGSKGILYSGKNNDYSHGVAVILSKEAGKSSLGYCSVSDRILILRIQGKPHNLSLIQCYAPTSNASEEEMEEFYNKRQSTTALAEISKSSWVILMQK